MNAPANLSKIEQIRARDGDLCWLCFGKLDFKAVPNSNKAPTKEHLTPQSAGGTNELANLVLCHPGCNKQLGNRTREEKLAMRAARQANRERQLAKPKQATQAKAPPPREYTPGEASAVVKDTLSLAASVRSPRERRSMSLLQRWQAFGLASAGTALIAIGILVGLLIAG